MIDPLGQQEALVTRLTGEDFVRLALVKADVSHPILVVVLEVDDVGAQLAGALEVPGFLFLLLLLGLVEGVEHAVARTLTIDGEALAAHLPGFHVEVADHLFGDVGRQVHGDGNGVVHPLLHRALQLDFLDVVSVSSGGFVIGRLLHERIDLLFAHLFHLLQRVALGLGPHHELVMEDHILLEHVADRVLDNGFGDGNIVGVDFAAALIDHIEGRFDAGGGLSADAHAAGGGDGEQGDVAAAVTDHVVVKLGIGVAEALNEGVVSLLDAAVDGECAALLGHSDGGAVGGEGQLFVHFRGEGVGLVGAVGESKGGEHVAFRGDAQSGTAALQRLLADLEPELLFHAFHVLTLGIALDLGQDGVNLLQLQVDNVVHQPLRVLHMLAEARHVEDRIVGERVIDVAVEVHGDEAAAVVGTERNFAAGVGGDGLEALVLVAVGDGLAEDVVPEEDTGLGRLPSVVDNLVPQLLGIDLPFHFGVVAADGILLGVGGMVLDASHELVIDAHGDVGAGDFALGHFCIYKLLGIRVFDGDGEHEGTAPSVLGHLAGGVGETFHKGNDAGGGLGAVLHVAACRTDVGHVVADAAAALHQLHLLLVHLHDAAVGVGVAAVANHEAVGKGNHLVFVADAGHGAALRNHVLEMVEQTVDELFAHRVSVATLDAGELAGHATVHVRRGALHQLAVGVLQRVFVNPNPRRQLVAAEIADHVRENLLLGEGGGLGNRFLLPSAGHHGRRVLGVLLHSRTAVGHQLAHRLLQLLVHHFTLHFFIIRCTEKG